MKPLGISTKLLETLRTPIEKSLIGEAQDGIGEALDGIGEAQDGIGEAQDGIGEAQDGTDGHMRQPPSFACHAS